jgi:protein-disulfide isomerase
LEGKGFMFKRMLTARKMILASWLICLALTPLSVVSQSKFANEASGDAGPTLGSASAPVTIIEFSDFQCSFCKRFWAETLPKLKEAYIDTGKARFVYRHFAILGKHSEQAALAAACAAEQGKFWEYHDQLFRNQGGLAFTEAKLKRYAGDLGLNGGVFGTCLGTGKYRAKIERETAAAANLGGRGTPFFIVNQRPLIGAQPYVVFQKMIDEELKAQESSGARNFPARPSRPGF